MPAEEGSLYLTQLGCYVHRYHRWLFVMKACEGGSAAYFATTLVNLIHACHCLNNQSQPFPGRGSPIASQDEPSYRGRG
ncbi:hypothetical protein BGW80DRAFT_1293399 [Lactifluus volemus]|nr:hypothetical protein BGW80DRAFT_1293399 [Lactifluus volemus]